MKKYCASVGAGLVLALSTQAMAVITDVNGLRIQLRRFNDFPSSTLVVTPPPGGGTASPITYGVAGLPDVTINETYVTGSGFANQHVVRLATGAGAADYRMAGPLPPPAVMSADAFDIAFDITLTTGSTLPAATKEAGFRLDSFVGGEAQFIVKSNGEVAAFNSVLPFFSFGTSAYTPGNRARLRMIYRPDDDPTPVAGDASTIEYLYDNNVLDATPALTSGKLEFSNLENGFIAGTDIGMYVQSPFDDSGFLNAGEPDFTNVAFQNISVAVPEPASVGLVSLAAVSLLMRRRK